MVIYYTLFQNFLWHLVHKPLKMNFVFRLPFLCKCCILPPCQPSQYSVWCLEVQIDFKLAMLSRRAVSLSGNTSLIATFSSLHLHYICTQLFFCDICTCKCNAQLFLNVCWNVKHIVVSIVYSIVVGHSLSDVRDAKPRLQAISTDRQWCHWNKLHYSVASSSNLTSALKHRPHAAEVEYQLHEKNQGKCYR